MNYEQAREYLQANPVPKNACPMTWDEAYELVSYSDQLTEEAPRVNDEHLWG